MAPKFDPKEPPVPLDSLAGRFEYFRGIFDPRLVLKSDQQIREALDLLEQYNQGTFEEHCPSDTSSLWQARRLKEAAVHPQTNDIIPLPFRMCSFVPVNVPICLGMLTATSPSVALFWQWFNQSYNVAVNYYNGNKSNPQSTAQIAVSYGLAVSVSCFLAHTLAGIAERAALSPLMRSLARFGVPYFAVAAAGAMNVLCMRSNEWFEGIDVFDSDGNRVGTSVEAGRRALLQTVLTRVVLPVPIIAVPGVFMSLVERLPVVRRWPALRLPLNLAVISGTLVPALPLAVGLFPQFPSVTADLLEPEFREHGTLFYNKGL